MDFLQINKFSELHDGKKIIFCKTDFLQNEFNYIKTLKNDVILITGNSDYPITDNHVKSAPNNIKKWFAQNALSNSQILEPLPLGLENRVESIRKGHGIGYFDRVTEKENLLRRNIEKQPTKFIYSNFKIETNLRERPKYKKLSIEIPHIDWEENLTLNQFFDKILDYKMVLCPLGNGVDTHRLWEVLYSNRIPITIKVSNYKIYQLYEKYPIIVLEKIEDLHNKELLEKKYQEIKEKKFNKDMLNYNYWKNQILNSL